MLKPYLIILSAVLLYSSGVVRAADENTLSALLEEANTQGSVNVIVQLQDTGKAGSERLPAASQALPEKLQRDLAVRGSGKFRRVKRYRHLPYVALSADAATLKGLSQSPQVAGIEPDILMNPVLANSMSIIGADNAWAAKYSGAGQTVAIIDTGVDKNHPMLAGKVIAEACFSTTSALVNSTSLCPNGQDEQIGTGTAQNCSGAEGCEHGTHVAAIAAGRQGVAKDAAIMAVQVFSRFDAVDICGPVSSPCVRAYLSDILAGLDWIYSLRDSISIAAINMSLGFGEFSKRSDCNGLGGPLKNLLASLKQSGIATVVAAGNDGYRGGVAFPACVQNAIAVGATFKNDFMATFSNWANYLNLLAPGAGITSAIPGGGTESLDGTSMAAPHVTGAFAVLKAARPTASVDTLLQILVRTGIPVDDTLRNYPHCVSARIQIDKALEVLMGNYGGSTSPLTAVWPAKNITVTKPAFQWRKVPTASQYRFILQQRNGQLLLDTTVNDWPWDPICDDSVCTYTPKLSLAGGKRYIWRVAAALPVGSSWGYQWGEVGGRFKVAKGP